MICKNYYKSVLWVKLVAPPFFSRAVFCVGCKAFLSFPRAGVGTHSRRASVEVKREFSFLLSFSDDELDVGASRLHSHAGAWERENTSKSKGFDSRFKFFYRKNLNLELSFFEKKTQTSNGLQGLT